MTSGSDPSSQQLYLVKWNHQLVNYRSSFAKYLKDQKFLDVTLCCQGNALKCHRLVLVASSQYFYEELTKNTVESKILVIQDMTFASLQKVVEFLYNGEVTMPKEELEGFLKAAEKLQVKGIFGQNEVGEILDLVQQAGPSTAISIQFQP